MSSISHRRWKGKKVLAIEPNTWRRKIREADEIRTLRPEMNRDNGYDRRPSQWQHPITTPDGVEEGVGGWNTMERILCYQQMVDVMMARYRRRSSAFRASFTTRWPTRRWVTRAQFMQLWLLFRWWLSVSFQVWCPPWCGLQLPFPR